MKIVKWLFLLVAVMLAHPLLSGQAAGLVTDDNLAAAIKQELGIEGRELTEADLLTLTTLNAANRNISSLEGLQFAVNLQFGP